MRVDPVAPVESCEPGWVPRRPAYVVSDLHVGVELAKPASPECRVRLAGAHALKLGRVEAMCGARQEQRDRSVACGIQRTKTISAMTMRAPSAIMPILRLM